MTLIIKLISIFYMYEKILIKCLFVFTNMKYNTTRYKVILELSS